MNTKIVSKVKKLDGNEYRLYPMIHFGTLCIRLKRQQEYTLNLFWIALIWKSGLPPIFPFGFQGLIERTNAIGNAKRSILFKESETALFACRYSDVFFLDKVHLLALTTLQPSDYVLLDLLPAVYHGIISVTNAWI